MYNSIVEVNKQFKSSVNLQFDLNNEMKISHYVPTTDLCDVIKSYIKSVLYNDGQRSTFLAGPYGKGKSYLVLMLTYLLGKRENKELFNSVIKKINIIDNELAEMLIKIDNDNISLLPVIVSNNSSDDFNQNFMLALNNALVDNGMQDIIPNSTFNECVKILENWEEERKNGNFDILTQCEEILNIKVLKLKEELQNFGRLAYLDFEKLFSCVSHGAKFNPLISNDIAYLYSDVCHNVKKYGYNGLFIVFDEFGTFLENQTFDFQVRLNKLQTLAEKCNSSSNEEQMHICCITHKDVLLYNTDKNLFDSFIKISGRFKSIRFDRSLDENYEIISSAIAKLEGYNKAVNEFVNKEYNFINRIENSMIFSKEQVKFLIDNCYPFNPISLFSLIQISEKIAQNERTMFTFISDNDVNTFRYFIVNNDNGLLNVNHVYDYFENIIRDNEEYKMSISYVIDSLTKETLDKEEHKIFKAVAINKIINDDIKLPCTIDYISLSLNIDIEETEKIINSLVSRNLLKINLSTGMIDFVTIIDKSLNDLIEKQIEIKLSNYSISSLFNETDINKYYISNKYNYLYRMVRYFKSVYVEEDQLSSINDLYNLVPNEYYDGLIITIVNHKYSSDYYSSLIKEKENNGTVIIRLFDTEIDNILIRKMKYLKACINIASLDKIDKKELNNLELIIDDLKSEIQTVINNCCNNASLVTKDGQKEGLQNIIFELLENEFYDTVIFNNEQVNKHIISKTTEKARNNVIDCILNDVEIEGSTSAEATIYNSFMEAIDTESGEYLINCFVNLLTEKVDSLFSISEIVNRLIAKPYGMRRGTIPLFITYVISKLKIGSENAIVLYNRDKEIEINADNISKIMTNPETYYIVNKQISKECIDFVSSLNEELGLENSERFENNIKLLVNRLKKICVNLEPIIIRATERDNILKLSDQEIKFKKLFIQNDLNPIDAILAKLPKILNCDFSEMKIKVLKVLSNFDKKVKELYSTFTKEIANYFVEGSTSSIKSNFDNWSSKYDYINSIIFEDQEKKIYNCLKNLKYDMVTSLDALSFAAINCSVKDWNKAKSEIFIQKIENFINIVENYEHNEMIEKETVEYIDEDELSFLGKTLLSNIEEVVEEYGAAVSNEEKTRILKLILKKVIE